MEGSLKLLTSVRIHTNLEVLSCVGNPSGVDKSFYARNRLINDGNSTMH